MNNAGMPTTADYAQNAADHARDAAERLEAKLVDALQHMASLAAMVGQLTIKVAQLEATVTRILVGP